MQPISNSGQMSDPNSTTGLFAQVVEFTLLVPALSLTVFLRQGLGYRIVRGRQIVGSCVAMLMIAGIGGVLNSGLQRGWGGAFSIDGAAALLLLAIAFVPVAMYHNRHDWQRVVNGQPGSTWNRGIPRLAAFLPIRADLVARFVEPALCIVLGMVFAFSMPLLGLWLVVGGLFIGLHESIARERYLAAFLDMLDGEYFGNRLNEDVQSVKGSAGNTAANEPAYDGVMPSLPPAMADKVRERQRLWQQQQQSAAVA